MTLPIIVALAAILGWVTPLRWGVAGFLGAAALCYGVHFGMLTAMGFEGLPLQESLLLFEGSLSAYLGFNAQVAYRAFAGPLVLLAALMIWRAGRR